MPARGIKFSKLTQPADNHVNTSGDVVNHFVLLLPSSFPSFLWCSRSFLLELPFPIRLHPRAAPRLASEGGRLNTFPFLRPFPFFCHKIFLSSRLMPFALIPFPRLPSHIGAHPRAPPKLPCERGCLKTPFFSPKTFFSLGQPMSKCPRYTPPRKG